MLLMDEVNRTHLLPTAILALQSWQEQTAHFHSKETQGHNWKSMSTEQEGVIVSKAFYYRQTMLKVVLQQTLTDIQ